MNDKRYDIKLSGKTIAVYGHSIKSGMNANSEVVDACRAVLAEHDLDEHGNERPLTVNGRPVEWRQSTMWPSKWLLWWTHHASDDSTGPTDDLIVSEIFKNDDNARRILAALHKALGVEPVADTNCFSCGWLVGHKCTQPSPKLCTGNFWKPKPPERVKLTVNGGSSVFGQGVLALWVDEFVADLDPIPRAALEAALLGKEPRT